MNSHCVKLFRAKKNFESKVKDMANCGICETLLICESRNDRDVTQQNWPKREMQ